MVLAHRNVPEMGGRGAEAPVQVWRHLEQVLKAPLWTAEPQFRKTLLITLRRSADFTVLMEVTHWSDQWLQQPSEQDS